MATSHFKGPTATVACGWNRSVIVFPSPLAERGVLDRAASAQRYTSRDGAHRRLPPSRPALNLMPQQPEVNLVQRAALGSDLPQQTLLLRLWNQPASPKLPHVLHANRGPSVTSVASCDACCLFPADNVSVMAEPDHLGQAWVGRQCPSRHDWVWALRVQETGTLERLEPFSPIALTEP